MNRLEAVKDLANKYIVVRHPLSDANREGIINGSLLRGKESYGATEEGKEALRQSVEARKQELTNTLGLLALSSRFKRAREGAGVIEEVLGVPYTIKDELNERRFGDLEGTSNTNYPVIWKADRENPDHTLYGVESANSVLERTTALIQQIERTYRGFTVLLISHGDPLQILETAFARMSVALHRDLPTLQPGEIRGLIFKSLA